MKRKVRFTKQSVLLSLTLLLLSIRPAQAHAQTTLTAAIPEFNSTSLSAFQRNGSANNALTDRLRITPSLNTQAGSAFWKYKVNLQGGFSTYFAFEMSNPQGGGADGIVFTIQPNSNNAGTSGGGIGFEGIPNSFGIEFDTWKNDDKADISDNHIGINVNGSVSSIHQVNSPFTLENGTRYHCWIDYDGTSVSVRLGTSNVRSASTVVINSYPLDVISYTGSDVFIGYTAATGGASANHDIFPFFFNNSHIPGGILPDTGDYITAPYRVTVTADASTIPSNGAAMTTISAAVLQIDGSPFPGQQVTFTDSDGNVLDTVTSNESGIATLTITAPDSPGSESIRAAAVGGAYGETTVTFSNVAPEITEGASTSVTMSEDGSPDAFALTLNATDVNPSTTLTWSIASNATYGTASASGTGAAKAISYTPGNDFNGSDSFVVRVSDGQGGTDTITVNVTVTPVNDAPVIAQGVSTAVTMSEDGSPTAFDRTLSATDVDGDTLTWSIATEATHGTATISGTGLSKAISYLPEPDYFGSDSFDVEVADGNGGTDTITVNVTIEPENDAPVITEGASASVTMSEDGSPIPFALTLNATDVDPDTTLTWSIAGAASHGTAAVSGTGLSKVITYAPEADYNGSDSFTVQVADGAGGTDTIAVNVSIEAQNDAPIITEGASVSVTMSEDDAPTPFSLTLNASDIDDGATLTWSISGAPAHGAAEVSGTGMSKAVRYSPTDNFVGTDSFVVTVDDGEGGTDSITVNVTIEAQDDAPRFPAGPSVSVTLSEDGSPTPFALTLTAEDPDAGHSLTWKVKTAAMHGTAAVSAGSADTNAISYIPAADYNGSDSFTVEVEDDTGLTASIIVNVTIEPVNDAPVITEGDAISKTISANGAPTPFSLTLHATDKENNTLTWSVTAKPAQGEAIASGKGASKAIHYQPRANYSGSDSFIVTVSDGKGGEDTITVNVTILPAHTDPELDTDGDGIPNDQDTDSDGDGIPDVQEEEDGSDPIDAGNNLPHIAAATCIDWNSFVGWNILETANKSDRPVSITLELYLSSGELIAETSYPLGAGEQFDYPIHTLVEDYPQNYGLVCITHSGNSGDVDGRMIKYDSRGDSADSFRYAAVSTMTNGHKGAQHFHYNTFQPSLDPAEVNHFVANFVEISNPGGTAAEGELIMYNQDGSVAYREQVRLPARSRKDLSIHDRVGQFRVGLASWLPNDREQTFVVRLSRYYYPDATAGGAIKGSIQAEGTKGTSALLVAPLDITGSSAVTEIGNVLDEEVTATLKVYTENGELKSEEQIRIPPKGSFHYISDYVLGFGARGIVTVQGSSPGSIVAQGLGYRRTATAGFTYAFSDYLQSPLGRVLNGSYNTFLEQVTRLIVINPTSVAQKATLTFGSVSASDDTSRRLTVPAQGLILLDMTELTGREQYGTVAVTPDTPNTLAAWVQRRKGEEFEVVTQLRN